MAQEFSIEQEYGRAIPPLVTEEVKEVEDDARIDAANVEELPDGSAVVELEGADDDVESEFHDNLAEFLPESTLTTLALDLIEAVERDKTAREKRDEQYEEGIRRTGLGNDAPGGASFEGASKIVHPIMAEACVDFSARAIKELSPQKAQYALRLLVMLRVKR